MNLVDRRVSAIEISFLNQSPPRFQEQQSHASSTNLSAVSDNTHAISSFSMPDQRRPSHSLPHPQEQQILEPFTSSYPVSHEDYTTSNLRMPHQGAKHIVPATLPPQVLSALQILTTWRYQQQSDATHAQKSPSITRESAGGVLHFDTSAAGLDMMVTAPSSTHHSNPNLDFLHALDLDQWLPSTRSSGSSSAYRPSISSGSSTSSHCRSQSHSGVPFTDNIERLDPELLQDLDMFLRQ